MPGLAYSIHATWGRLFAKLCRRTLRKLSPNQTGREELLHSKLGPSVNKVIGPSLTHKGFEQYLDWVNNFKIFDIFIDSLSIH